MVTLFILHLYCCEQVIHSLIHQLQPATLLCCSEYDGVAVSPASFLTTALPAALAEPESAAARCGAACSSSTIDATGAPSSGTYCRRVELKHRVDIIGNSATCASPSADKGTAAGAFSGVHASAALGSSRVACDPTIQIPLLTRQLLDAASSISGEGCCPSYDHQTGAELLLGLHEWLGALSCGLGKTVSDRQASRSMSLVCTSE